MAEIRIEGLRKAFGDFVAVRNSTFTIDDGAFFVMLGPSGCGKTTTLRMIAGLELPTEGRVYGRQAALAVGITIPLMIVGLVIRKHLARGFSFGMVRR